MWNLGSSAENSGNSRNLNNLTTMEGFVRAYNELIAKEKTMDLNEKANVPQKIAELSRRYKDAFEKKTGDIESFMVNCNEDYGTIAILACMKAMFDNSSSKSFEAGTDRAVELLKHYMIDTAALNPTHARLIPDIVFPFIRDAAFYCLVKKDRPMVGYDISLAGLRLMTDPSQKMISSLHAAFFATCLKLQQFDEALPYIYTNVKGIYQESSYAYTPALPETENKKNRGSATALPPVYMDSKYMLEYLYYGALIMIKKSELNRAIALLEGAILVPGASASLIQIDAMKKYMIISPLVYGHAYAPVGRSATLQRAWKSRGEVYQIVGQIGAARGVQVAALEKVITENYDLFAKDNNIGLLRRLLRQLQLKAVLQVAKSFSTIRMIDLVMRAQLPSAEAALEILQRLAIDGRLYSEVNHDEGFVKLTIPTKPVTSADLFNKMSRLDELTAEANRLDIEAQTCPLMLARSIKAALPNYFNEDEGLSMAAGSSSAILDAYNSL